MADDLTTQVLIQIRDRIDRGFTELESKLGARIDDTNQRIDDTNQRLSVLATLTRSIDGRLEKIEERAAEHVFLPHRVEALEETSEAHEARIARLEAAAKP